MIVVHVLLFMPDSAACHRSSRDVGAFFVWAADGSALQQRMSKVTWEARKRMPFRAEVLFSTVSMILLAGMEHSSGAYRPSVVSAAEPWCSLHSCQAQYQSPR